MFEFKFAIIADGSAPLPDLLRTYAIFHNRGVSAQYFGEPEFMGTTLDNDWLWRNIQTSLLRAAKPRRYSHHGGEVYNPARNSP